MLSLHYLQLSVIFTTVQAKQKGAQTEWDAIAERIHRSGESGAPLHLKIKAYHVDIARDEARRPGLKLDDIGSIAVPRQSCLKRIDADGTWPFEDVKAEVRAMPIWYFNLVLADQTKDKARAEVARGLITTMDVSNRLT